MIIYIHGFGGSGKGMKASILKDAFNEKRFISPTLSYVPDLAIDTLEQIIESLDEEIYLIGSSLGGYYSIYLANKYNCRAVLINPSIEPTITLSKVLGQALNYGDLSKFEWNEQHIEMLKKYKVKNPNKENFFLLVQTEDELLDYNVAVNYLKGSQQIVEEGGDHTFKNIIDYKDAIEKFFDLRH
jgi:predicted esterase YcpF (UPF0227 family)